MEHVNRTYPNINLEKTGTLLREKVSEQGYTVKDIQEYLGLSCPQPVYRWFKGKMLPSLDHLLMLSRILEVHMEELLVLEIEKSKQEAEGDSCVAAYYDMWGGYEKKRVRRGLLKRGMEHLSAYWEKLHGGVA